MNWINDRTSVKATETCEWRTSSCSDWQNESINNNNSHHDNNHSQTLQADLEGCLTDRCHMSSSELHGGCLHNTHHPPWHHNTTISTVLQHNKQLPARTGHLTDGNFITRLLYKDCYWTLTFNVTLYFTTRRISIVTAVHFVIVDLKEMNEWMNDSCTIRIHTKEQTVSPALPL